MSELFFVTCEQGWITLDLCFHRFDRSALRSGRFMVFASPLKEVRFLEFALAVPERLINRRTGENPADYEMV